jgi:hypothetical protein
MRGSNAKAGEDAGIASRARAMIAATFCAGAAWSLPLFPAVKINLDAASGQSIAWTSFAIGSVLMGAASFYVAEKLLEHGRLGRSGFYFALAMAFLTLNLAQSIGNASAHSEGSRDDRAARIAAKAKVASSQTILANRRNTVAALAGEAAVESLEAEAQAKRVGSKLWQKSESCQNATTLDSRNFCADLANLAAKIAAARKRDEIDKELATLAGKDVDGAPASVDPFAANVARFLGLFGIASGAEAQVTIADARVWGQAIGVEILALFGPAALMALFGGFPTEARCLVPLCDGISLTDPKLRERLWNRYFTAAPRQRTPSELQYSDRKLRPRS